MEKIKTINILLIEDDPGDQKLIKVSFQAQKLANNLVIVNSGEEAIEYLHLVKQRKSTSIRPDLILLDLNMPGMGGIEFLKRIKNDPDAKSIPVVVLTTSDSDEDIMKSYELQAAGYIKKPVKLEDFKSIVKSIEHYWFVICKTPGE